MVTVPAEPSRSPNPAHSQPLSPEASDALNRIYGILQERVLACARNWHWDVSDPAPLSHVEGCALCLDLREAIRILTVAFPTKPGGRPKRHVDMSRLSALLADGLSPRAAAHRMDLGYGTVLRALGRERKTGGSAAERRGNAGETPGSSSPV